MSLPKALGVDATAATAPAPAYGPGERGRASSERLALWALGGITALGAAVRFADLGLQSYHHDEVITVARVLGGSFGHMLHEVRVSESNPPLYYALAWLWSQWTGLGEAGLRSLSALFGVATVPVAYLAGAELANRRAGLIAAALVAVNPMLIWYSQEARSYAPLVFFGALSLFFFVRSLRTARSGDLALWALASGLALWSHYFAFFPVAIEAAWLLASLRSSRAFAAVAAVGAAGAALLPLLVAQANPHHIGWIDRSPLPGRLLQAGVSFLAGETGHVIAEPPRMRYALVPAIFAGVALLLLVARGRRREWRAAGLALVLGLGVVALAAGAALLGHDYVVERNLLPALVPLAVAVAVGFSAAGARRVGAACAIALCAYWLAFDVYVTKTPNLQRPDFRALAGQLGPARSPRAIVTWKLAAEPLQLYLADGARRAYGGRRALGEIDFITKPESAPPSDIPRGFRPVQRVRLDRLTLLRYMSANPRPVRLRALRHARTGFGKNAIVIDRPAPAGVAR